MPLIKINKESHHLLTKVIKDWHSLIDTMNYPVFIVDCSFNIVMHNKSFLETFGEHSHSKCFKLFHGTDKPVHNCPMSTVLKTGESVQIEITSPFSDKSMLVNASPVFHDQEVIGVIHSLMDVSDLKPSDDGMGELIDIYASSINELKARELRAQKGRDAFLNMLEDINESYKELEDLFLKLIVVMVNALDAKSPWTKGHSERVSMYAEEIAEELMLDADDIKNVKLAGLLHDIGKIGTYDYLLNKPGKLTRDEFEIVKKHPSQGAEILKDIKQFHEVIPFIKYHHEKLDGNGYPTRLKGARIPLGARILHVADSFDSMTSDRPYRPAPGLSYALSELEKHKATQFDENVVNAFLKVLQKSKTWGPKLS